MNHKQGGNAAEAVPPGLATSHYVAHRSGGSVVAALAAGVLGFGMLTEITLGSPLTPSDVFATWSLPSSEIRVGQPEQPAGVQPPAVAGLGAASRGTAAGRAGAGGGANGVPAAHGESASQPVGAGGPLTLTAAGGHWAVRAEDGSEHDVDPANLVVVPGDVLVYRDTVAVSAGGDVAAATLTSNAGEVERSIAWLTVDVALSADGRPIADGARIDVGADGRVLDVLITVTFPRDATTPQGQAAELPQLTLRVTQDVRG